MHASFRNTLLTLASVVGLAVSTAHAGTSPNTHANAPAGGETTKAKHPMSGETMGHIVSFDAKTGALVVARGDKKSTYFVDSTCSLTMDGKSATAADLVPGRRVALTSQDKEGHAVCSMVAIHEARSSGPAHAK